MKLTIEQATAMLEHLGEMQESGAVDEFSCPRCGRATMRQKATRNALSRRVHVYVCPECGMAEALEDAAFRAPLQLNDWAMTRSFGA